MEPLAEDHLICPIGVPSVFRSKHTGQELAPASTAMVDRLLWRRRARPSATLDKMRTKLLCHKSTPESNRPSRQNVTQFFDFVSRGVAKRTISGASPSPGQSSSSHCRRSGAPHAY